VEALKWIGYIVAAIAVLSVVLGTGLFIVALITIGGALTFATMLVLLVASAIKGACTPTRRKS
jgi:hypothetical protein